MHLYFINAFRTSVIIKRNYLPQHNPLVFVTETQCVFVQYKLIFEIAEANLSSSTRNKKQNRCIVSCT
jgi:hypothetical protein